MYDTNTTFTHGTLRVLNGPTKGDIAEIRPTLKTRTGRPVFAIGHHTKADLYLPDSHIKPVHALIVRETDGGYLITPKQGTVLINDTPVHEPTRLYTKDRVKLGRTVLAFKGAEREIPISPAPQPKPKKPTRESTAGEKFIWAMYAMAAVVVFGLIALGVNHNEQQAAQRELLQQELAASGTPVTVLFFQADWCGYCERQAPTMRALDREYGEYVDVTFIDVDDATNVSLERQFGVRSIPHTIVLDGDGRVSDQFIGYTERNRLERAIDGVY